MKCELSMYNRFEGDDVLILNFGSFELKFNDKLAERQEIGWDEHKIISIENEEWIPGHSSLDLSFGIQLKGSAALFGQQGVCSEQSKLGLVCHWKSIGSDIRGSSSPIEFTSGVNEVDGVITLSFNAEMLRDRLDLRLNIVLLEAVNPLNGIHCQLNGTILGEIGGTCRIAIDGHNPGFKVVTSDKNKNEALWEMLFEVSEPEDDLVIDTFGLIINRNHPRYFDLLERNCHNAFFKEVLQSLLLDFMMAIKEHYSDVLDDAKRQESPERKETITDYVWYLTHVHSLDLSDYEGLRKTIRLIEFQ